MKRLIIITLFLALMMSSEITSAQGFEPPSEGKAVVYFARPTKYGKVAPFEFFHNDKYIGVFIGEQYMRYECDPGEHLFWASSENKDYMSAELEAGETYIVIINVVTGFWVGHVALSPIDSSSEKLFYEAKELINNQPPEIMSEEHLAKKNKKLEKFIRKRLKDYEKKVKGTRNEKHLSAGMSFPQDMLN